MDDFGLTAQQRAALRRAAAAGEYHLLLGAGASRDAIAPDGTRLPTSSELARLLSAEFGVPFEEGDLLWRVYSRAIEEVGEAAVYRWLRERYWGVTPPAWMDSVARASWAAIWTLNIDDSFEAAYARVHATGARRVSTVNWDDSFRISNDLAVIHLHGCVDRDEPRKLVMSLSDYQDVALAGAVWPLVFRDVYGASPFVIIGARLRDEPDIEAVVANRKPTHPAPTFYVSPSISAAVEQDLRRWHLVPARMTGAEFSVVWQRLTGLTLEG